jgi:triacylglycerol esterase/lipase EstA (alpha/beta hydrolase family)
MASMSADPPPSPASACTTGLMFSTFLERKSAHKLLSLLFQGTSFNYLYLSWLQYVGPNRTGSIISRAITLDQQLQTKAHGRGINFLAHSMGGLDCRHLITHIKPAEYTPLSLTTISTPHRGSPFMDWCAVRVAPLNILLSG